MSSDELKALLKNGDYLARYLAETGRAQISGGGEKQISCPDKSKHSHGDKNPSARYYPSPDEHIHCHGCGGTWDLFALVEADRGIGFKDAEKWCAEHWGLDFAPSDNPVARYISDCEGAYKKTDYLKKRGISDEVARRFRVGFDEKDNRIVFPQGSGYVARSIKEKISEGELRYKYPKGRAVSPFNLAALWNIDKDPVFIVEGQIDALSIVEVGGQAVGLGGITHQKALLEAIRARPVCVPVCVAFDNEKSEKTRAAEKELVGELQRLGVEIFRARIYPDDCKDANDALLKDREKFKGSIISSYEDLRIEKMLQAKSTFSLWEVPEPISEEKNPRALIKNGYFRKGHGALLVSTSGAGKSVMSIQMALHLAIGKPFFGIEPVRALKVGIIQAEDDMEELGFFKSNMSNGLKEEYAWTDEEIERACKGIHFETVLGKTGDDFVQCLKDIQRRAGYDLIIVNPLFSFFGGNLSDSKDDAHFFREMIDPLIKNPVYGFGLIFIHHANKPPRGQDRKGWGTDAFAQYIGAGGTDVAGWARAQLVLTPIDGHFGWFKLIAAKRAGQLGWTDSDGNKTTERIIRYGKGRVLWCEPAPDEIPEEVKGEAAKSATPSVSCEEAIKKMVEHLKAEPLSQTELFKWACKNFVGMKSVPEKPCKRAYLTIVNKPEDYGLEVVPQKHGGKLLRFRPDGVQMDLRTEDGKKVAPDERFDPEDDPDEDGEYW